MKHANKAKPQTPRKPVKLDELRARLREAEETLSAIRNGEVDALIVTGPQGDQVFSLKGAEQPYRVFVEQMQQGALTLAPDGTILFCNRKFAELIRTPLENVIGSEFSAHIGPEDRGAAQELLAIAEKTKSPVRIQLRASDGTLVAVSLTLSDLPLDDMNATCVVVTDLTEQEELLASEQANQAKDNFLAALSHELRTPLTPVLMTVSALEMDDRLPADVREGLVMLRRNIELEARLIDDLLDLTRIARGKVEMKLVRVDLNEALRSVLAICAPDLQQKKLKFSTDLQARNASMSGDEARIHQILWNLLRNAIKFTPAGGAVSVSTRNAGGMLEMRICDTGIGIDADAMTRIFKPFEQASKEITRSFGGLGLGLAISRRFVDMHGGSLSVESEGPGRGATFILQLPVTDESAVRTAPKSPELPGHAAANRTLRILLVEDHFDTATLLGKLLRRFGHDVAIAGSRADALKLAASSPFDVLLSDIGLPDGTGHELMREIRQMHAIPGIALTGYGMEEDVSRSRDAGFVEHVVKPVNIDRLQEVLVRATRR